MSVNIIAALVVVVLLSVFAYQNGAPVQMNFISWTSPEVPVWAVVIAAFLFGGLITYLLDTVRVLKAGRNLRQESKRSRQYRKELKELRAEVERLKGRKKKTVAIEDSRKGGSDEGTALSAGSSPEGDADNHAPNGSDSAPEGVPAAPSLEKKDK